MQHALQDEPLWTLKVRNDCADGICGWAELLGVVLLFGLACLLGEGMSNPAQHVTAYWPANGILVAFLLVRPHRRWGALIAAAWLANLVCNLGFGVSAGAAALAACCNAVEIALASFLLGRRMRHAPDLSSREMLRGFTVDAVLLAPAVSTLLAAVGLHLLQGVSFAAVVRSWFPADMLGMAILAPLTVGLLQHGPGLPRIQPKRLLPTLGWLGGVLAVAMAVFSQSRYPVLFLVFPLLLLVLFEAGMFPALLSILIVASTGGVCILRGHGPFRLHGAASPPQSILLFQIYILVTLACILPVGATLQRQRILRARLREGMKRYQLLANNSRDIVVLSTLGGRREYVSPAVQDVLGWTQEEWTHQDSTDLMHPEDVEGYRRMLQEMLHGQDCRIFCYRTRHKDGRYLWMEASIRLLLDEETGKPSAFIGNVRDVSQRVDAERKLEAAYQQMQEQAQRDGLTGLHNRRRFDEVLELEWRRNKRSQKPLALLMVDLDRFKQINDQFGHRVGDHCLQVLALSLQQMGRRPGDLVARYGGEEFVVLLPGVDLLGAMIIAERLCRMVRMHPVDAGTGQPIKLTVSVGVAARVPEPQVRADSLVEAADRAMYAAKAQGRDRVLADPEGEACEILALDAS